MSEWQPIESAPRDGRVIICWGHGSAVLVESMRFYPDDDDPFSGEFGWLEGDVPKRQPTHWKPLETPEPPK